MLRGLAVVIGALVVAGATACATTGFVEYLESLQEKR